MSIMQPPRSGPNFVAEYQVSSLPYVTSSTVLFGETKHIEFPYVTSWITLQNISSSNVNFGFTERGLTTSNFYTVLPSGSINEIHLRVKDLFITAPDTGTTGSYQLLAGLTMVRRMDFPTLTGSAAPAVLSPLSSSDDFGYDFGLELVP